MACPWRVLSKGVSHLMESRLLGEGFRGHVADGMEENETGSGTAVSLL